MLEVGCSAGAIPRLRSGQAAQSQGFGAVRELLDHHVQQGAGELGLAGVEHVTRQLQAMAWLPGLGACRPLCRPGRLRGAPEAGQGRGASSLHSPHELAIEGCGPVERLLPRLRRPVCRAPIAEVEEPPRERAAGLGIDEPPGAGQLGCEFVQGSVHGPIQGPVHAGRVQCRPAGPEEREPGAEVIGHTAGVETRMKRAKSDTDMNARQASWIPNHT